MSRVAIVTGASRGIGRATAIRLARNFGAVAIVARTADTLAATADAIRPDGAEPLILARDPREPEAGEAHALELDAATERFAAEVGIARCGRPDDIAPREANGSRAQRCASMAEKRRSFESPNSGTTIWVDRRFRWGARCASEPSRPSRSPFVRP